MNAAEAKAKSNEVRERSDRERLEREERIQRETEGAVDALAADYLSQARAEIARQVDSGGLHATCVFSATEKPANLLGAGIDGRARARVAAALEAEGYSVDRCGYRMTIDWSEPREVRS